MDVKKTRVLIDKKKNKNQMQKMLISFIVNQNGIYLINYLLLAKIIFNLNASQIGNIGQASISEEDMLDTWSSSVTLEEGLD